MASVEQRAAWKQVRLNGATITQAKQILKFTIEEVQDCEHMLTQHERRVW